jgi:hypothetical protein
VQKHLHHPHEWLAHGLQVHTANAVHTHTMLMQVTQQLLIKRVLGTLAMSPQMTGHPPTNMVL